VSACPRLRLVRGGRNGSRLGPLRVVAAPPEEPPFAVAATVVEEDTWLVLSAEPDIKPSADHPVRIMTELLEAEPLAPGSVVAGSKAPLQLLAVIYDLGQEPICRPEWVASALGEVFRITEEQNISTLALPLLGIRHGRLPVNVFLDIFANSIRETPLSHLRKVWLSTEAELTREVRSLLEAYARPRMGK
jgi:hypothetical protein